MPIAMNQIAEEEEREEVNCLYKTGVAEEWSLVVVDAGHVERLVCHETYEEQEPNDQMPTLRIEN